MLTTEKIIVQLILFGLLIASFMVLTPFLTALFWAALLAFASWPLMRFLTKKLHNKSKAALYLTILWVFVVSIPLVILAIKSGAYIKQLNDFLISMQDTAIPQAPEWFLNVPVVSNNLIEWWDELRSSGDTVFVTIKPYLASVGNWLLSHSTKIGNSLVELALSLFLLFFFYRDGEFFANFCSSLLEKLIGDVKAKHYFSLVSDTVQRVINGVIGTAVVQAILAYIGFNIVQSSAAILLSVAMFFSSLVMLPPLVWIPVSVWLIAQDSMGFAVFLMIWGFFVIGGVENFIKPYLISKGGNLPLILVLIGVIGGMISFGFMGIFLGPTLLAVVYSLINSYVKDNE